MAYAPFDPVARLSWLARLRWRRAERRVRREFESDTLAELRRLAADGPLVSWASRIERGEGDEAQGILGPVELSAGGHRIAAQAVWGPAWSAVCAAAAQGRVHLAGAGRYSGSWYLRFRIVGGEPGHIREIPLLGAGLRILPHLGGGSLLGGSASPLQPSFA